MNAIEPESLTLPVDAEPLDSAAASRAPEPVPEPQREPGRESESGRGRVRRPPYTRDFREFVEQLGEERSDFDQFRRGLWETFEPSDAFEVDLLEDMVENRWELRRVKRTRQAKLVEIRRRKEVKRQEHLASQGRGVAGKAHLFIMKEQGVSSLPDSEFKFERTILFLTALRARVELEGFTEWGLQCLTVVFGEKTGLFSSELVLGYDAGRKAEEQGDEEARDRARRSFLVALEEEIAAYGSCRRFTGKGQSRFPRPRGTRTCYWRRKTLTICCGRRECWNWSSNSSWSSGRHGGGAGRESE